MYTKSKKWFRCVALMLILALLCPLGAGAVEPRDSDYVKDKDASLTAVGLGKVRISFTVVGKGTMTDVGARRIQIYESSDNESFGWVATISSADYTNMLGHNTVSHSSYVEYQGVVGRYYRAFVTAYAADADGDGAVSFWTSSVKATLLAG